MQWIKNLRCGTVALMSAFAIVTPHTVFADTITLAEADTLTGENLVQLVAIARAKERGVDAEIVSLKSDDVVFQAVLNGQIDIGIGTAYAAQQTLGDRSVLNFYQLRRLAYFPVVNKEKYSTWKDLDGETITVHARGSGTEAIARFMEGVHDIKFGDMSFVPGSEVRAVALRRGTVDATFLDITNTRLVTQENPDKFGLLPMGDTTGSDSVLYATETFLEENEEAVQILVEELMRAAKEFNADPTLPAKLRDEFGLLEDLPDEMVDEITPYFETATAAGLFPEDGGGEKAALADIAFLSQSGALTGEASEIDPEDFWTFDIAEKAKAALQ